MTQKDFIKILLDNKYKPYNLFGDNCYYNNSFFGYIFVLKEKSCLIQRVSHKMISLDLKIFKEKLYSSLELRIYNLQDFSKRKTIQIKKKLPIKDNGYKHQIVLDDLEDNVDNSQQV